MTDKLTALEVTPTHIENWKKQYGSIARIKVMDNGEEKINYVRKPTNKEIDYAGANLTRGALTQYGITLFNTCMLAGDKIVSEDALRSVGQQMSQMIESVEADLEKL